MRAEDPKAPNSEFYEKVERAFRALFDMARAKHELHFALALMPEMRGMQDAGWNSAVATAQTFDAYCEFIEKIDDQQMKAHVMIGFYCHVSEASGFYEVPKNMLRIAQGEKHNLWPFMHLVKAHRDTGRRIAPNANKVLRDLAGHAAALGLTELAEVFRDAFDGDIRNGYAHADYVVWKDGIRLPMRNGGHGRKVPWEEFNATFERGINFFHILRAVINESIQSYNPPKKLTASLNEEPPTEWTIFADAVRKTFGISSGGGAAPKQPPAAQASSAAPKDTEQRGSGESLP